MMYKKIAAFVAGGLLCLNFSGIGQVKDIVQSGLVIGDTVPYMKIDNVYMDGEGMETSLNLSDYRNKLLIIDFWATWCAPCIQMMPVVDELQSKFSGRVNFLEVTHEPAELVLPFIAKLNQARKRKSIIPVAVGDVRLGDLFRHVYLPHYVWILNGKVVAITGSNEVNEGRITAILDGAVKNVIANMPVKKDIRRKYERDKSLFFSGNGGEESNIRAYSFVGKYTDGIGGGWAPRKDKIERIFGLTGRNCSFFWLFRIAYRDLGNFGISTLSYKGADSLAFYLRGLSDAKLDSLKRNGYSWCYESALDTGLRDFKGYELKQVLDRMKADLSRFFPQYEPRIVKRKVVAYVIERNGSNKVFEDKGESGKLEVSNNGFYISGMGLEYLVFRLNNQIYDFKSFPIVDHTGYEGNVKLNFTGNPRSIKELEAFFLNNGLKLVKKSVRMDVLDIQHSEAGKGGGADEN